MGQTQMAAQYVIDLGESSIFALFGAATFQALQRLSVEMNLSLQPSLLAFVACVACFA